MNYRKFLRILGSAKTEFYRNKLEFTFSDKRWLTEEEVKADVKYDQMNAVGFHIPGAFDKVLAIEKCWLQDDISNQIRNAVRDYAYEHNYSFFNLRTQEGMTPQSDDSHIKYRRVDGIASMQNYRRERNGANEAVIGFYS